MKKLLQKDPVREGQNEYIKSKSQIYMQNFHQAAKQRFIKLRYSIVGNYEYQPINQFGFKKKQKIFQYLRSKYMTSLSSAQEELRRKFTSYDINKGINIEFKSLSQMKQTLLSLKTNIEAAQEKKSQIQASSRNLKSNFFNEIAYEFDKQRYISIGWGLVFGAFICSTSFRKGSLPRKTALFLTCGHTFGQYSYHVNLNKYFDSIYDIFQEDAMQYIKQQQQLAKQNPKSYDAGIVED